MAGGERLSAFVREALAAGRGRNEIAGALARAGWSDGEIRAALAGWDSRPGLPPVPRPRSHVSAREAVLYGLLFVALGATVWHLVSLGLALVDRWVPTPGDRPAYYGPTGIRRSIAVLVVLYPVVLALDWRLARAVARDPGLGRSPVRRWFAAIAMLLATLTLLGDLIAVVAAWLGGDLTLRFGLKALLVGAVAVSVLLAFRPLAPEALGGGAGPDRG